MAKLIIDSSRTEALSHLFLEQQPLLRQISTLEPQLRDNLTQIYFDLTPEQEKRLVEFQEMKGSTATNSKEILNHMQLAALLFATFPSGGKEDYLLALNSIKFLREELKIGKNQKLLIETLLKIKNSTLNDERKFALINLLFKSKEWPPTHLALLRDLLAFKAEDELEKLASLEELKITLEKVFIKRFEIKINNFSVKYEKTLGKWRNKEALTTYASKLNELNEAERKPAQQFLSDFVQSVLEETFHENRYKTDHNPHLKEIESSHFTVYKKWQQQCQLDISEIQPSDKDSSFMKFYKSIETFQKKITEIPVERLDIYKVNLKNLEEELIALQPKLELAIKESEPIEKNIVTLSHKSRELREQIKHNKKDISLTIQLNEIKTNLTDQSSKKELSLKQQLQTQEALLKALIDPRAENFIRLQNFLNKEVELYKKNADIVKAIKELLKCIEDSLEPKGILAEEDFEIVLKPIREGINELLSTYPDAYSQLKASLEDEEKLESSIQQIDKHLNQLTIKEKSRKEQESIKLQQSNFLKEKALLEVIKKPEIKQLKALLSLFNREDTFYKKIETALTLSKQHLKSQNIMVIDTDDPNHFLLLGTEVKSSCQSVDAGVHYNKCLLGYILDGKHRLCLVCDPSGKILARSVLRLLVDDKNQPVLFQEKIYVADESPKYRILIRKIAKNKAQSLNIPLVVSIKHFAIENNSTYVSDIYAKDKPVPFEYVDALEKDISTSYTLHKEMIFQV